MTTHPNRSTKMSLEILTNGNVQLSYDDNAPWVMETGARETRTFTCRSTGGYVYELLPRGERTQVCDQLAHRGSTLMASADGKSLAAVIRREYRAMRRAEAAFRRAGSL